MKLVYIPELEFVLKNERTNKFNLLHKFSFDSKGDRSNRKNIRGFSCFGFQTYSTDFKYNVDLIQAELFFKRFSKSNDLLCFSNEESIVDLKTRLIPYLSDLN